MPTQQLLLGGGAGAIDDFSLTLESSNNSALGDTSTVQNNWWSSQTYSTEVITNIGQQSYQGFYAFTAGKNATMTVNAGGAAGWANVRGRNITANFSISTGDRIVFFAGKPSYKSGNQQLGGGGGATCVMKYLTSSSDSDFVNNFLPLVIAAGGGAGGPPHGSFNSGSYGSNYELAAAARALSVTTGNTLAQIASARSNNQSGNPYSSISSGAGGVGRGYTNNAQGGGAGWSTGSFIENAALNPGLNGSGRTSEGLAYGARGDEKQNSNGSDGGFGGGGGDYDDNYYGSGGGGYWGGYESSAATDADSQGRYKWYTSSGGLGAENEAGALSFAHSSGTNVTDVGLWSGTNSRIYGDTNDANQIKGRVVLSFTNIS